MKLDEWIKESLNEWRGMKPGFERMEAACARLGHPERKLPSIHIAGTNGKGSVAAMLHSILSEAGYRAGIFTSPHLVRVNERFRVGGKEITDGELEEILRRIEESGVRSQESGLGLSFFELCTLIAFLYFVEKKVDLAVVEVGLGGRLDATNVVTPLVSVVTEISLDHTEILGDDIASIAREKAGIIKEGVPVVCGARDPEAMRVIEGVAREKRAKIFYASDPDRSLELSLQGDHQFHNAAIAMKVIEVLNSLKTLPSPRPPLRERGEGEKKEVDEKAIREGLKNVHWPGRMEWVSRDPPILMDVAHNPAGMRALVKALKSRKAEGTRWKILFSAASDKAVDEMLQILSEIANEITICRMENARSIDPSSFTLSPLSERGQGEGRIHSGGNAFETYRKMAKELKEGEGLLVTGSLYLIGEIKAGLTRPTNG